MPPADTSVRRPADSLLYVYPKVRDMTGDADSELTLLSREDLEERIRERTAYLNDVMNTMVDVLLRTDAHGRIEMANDAVADVLGYDPGDVEGKPIDVVFASPEANPQLASMFDRGTFVERLLEAGQLTDVEIYFETSDGDTIPMSVSASLTTDSDGHVTGIVCVAKDISERKDAEETAEFLHSLLRHDLGNKLQMTQGYLDLLAEQSLPADLDEYVENGRDGVQDATDLIEKVRTLRQSEGEDHVEPTAVDDAVRDAIERNAGLAERHGFDVEADVDDHVVRGGRLLPELFANLVENALKHSGGSTIEITARRNGDTVTVSVADDGDGIPPSERDRLFEKGRTGTDSDGSGLGMHLAARLASNYGGDIDVHESDAGGARFDVHLDAVD
jgi:PAS domain S-box-containing protein